MGFEMLHVNVPLHDVVQVSFHGAFQKHTCQLQLATAGHNNAYMRGAHQLQSKLQGILPTQPTKHTHVKTRVRLDAAHTCMPWSTSQFSSCTHHAKFRVCVQQATEQLRRRGQQVRRQGDVPCTSGILRGAWQPHAYTGRQQRNQQTRHISTACDHGTQWNRKQVDTGRGGAQTMDQTETTTGECQARTPLHPSHHTCRQLVVPL
jgi:hypothetical protein